MSTLLRIALRNVARHRRCALITAITMAAGIALFIWLDSLMDGMDRLSVDNLINLRDSSVKVFTTAYESDRASYPLKDGIADPAALAAKLQRDPRVVEVAPRTEFLAQAGNYRDSLPVVGIVVDPVRDPKVFALNDYLIGRPFSAAPAAPSAPAALAAPAVPATTASGPAAASASSPTKGSPVGVVGGASDWSTAGPGAPPSSRREIIVGKALAEKLGLSLGHSILLEATTRYGAVNADDFTIVGLLNSSDPALSQSTVFIPYDEANDFLDLGGLTTELDLKLAARPSLADAVREANTVAAEIRAADPALTAKSFAELDSGFLKLLAQKRAGYVVIVLIILLIAAVGIVNTVLMSVYERVREVGVLKALGFRNREVVWMFTIEGLVVGLLGSLLGVIVGIALEAQLIFVGLPLDKIANFGSAGIPFWGRLYGAWNPGSILLAVVFGLAVSLLASLIPARGAARMTATAALHFV